MNKILICIVFVLPSLLFSQTTIEEGDVSGIWTAANSPYLIEGNVSIALSDTLTIEPGVFIEFQDYYTFIVKGILNAQGTITDTITFSVNDTTGYHNLSHAGWGGIKFDETNDNDSSYLDFCKIEYGKGTSNLGGGMNIRFSNLVSISNTLIQFCSMAMPGKNGGGGLAVFGSSPKLRNLIIRNNYSDDNGGGLYMEGYYYLDVDSVIISNNESGVRGGGLYVEWGYSTLNAFTIENNTAMWGGGLWSESNIILVNSSIINNAADNGGGVYVKDNNIEINNTKIANNSSAIEGGGVYFANSANDNSKVLNCIIRNNNSHKGGGIFIDEAYTLLENNTIDSNYATYGGGIWFGNSEASLAGLSIRDNSAYFGGGIYFGSKNYFSLNMNATNLCSIYSNLGKIGKDLFTKIPYVNIRVDTFSVMTPTDYYAIPSSRFSFSINQGLQQQINADLFVSPDGSDLNDGLSEDAPFKTIDHAMSVLVTSNLNHHTIWLDNGVYSPSLSNEVFPLTLCDNLSLQGNENSILDADSAERILYAFEASDLIINNLNLRNGNTNYYGGGLFFENSSANLNDIAITSCLAHNGGAIAVVESNLLLNEILINSNKAIFKGGGIYNNKGYIVFDTNTRSNIYSNSASVGNDLSTNSAMHVVVDTFTVMQPTAYHAKSLELFIFDIQHGKIEQISSDVYVSPEGDNNNSGLSWDSPFKTLKYASGRINTNTSDQITVNLGSGVYSTNTNNETMPVYPIDNCAIKGHDTVVFDGVGLTNIFKIVDVEGLSIDNIMVQNGYAELGAGLYIEGSEVNFSNLIATNNRAGYKYGGLYAYESSVSISGFELTNNTAMYFGGAVFENSTVDIFNSLINGNYSYEFTALSFLNSNAKIVNAQITNNSERYSSSAGLTLYNSTAEIINSTFSDNFSNNIPFTSIYVIDYNYLDISNCVFWNEDSEYDIVTEYGWSSDPPELNIKNSSLSNGEASISLGGYTILNYDTTNISGNPGFQDYAPYPYQIGKYSPCIDLGTIDTTDLNLPLLDLAGNARISNGRVDMGAFEWSWLGKGENYNTNNSNLSVYPNPTSNYVTLSVKPNTNITEVNIYNQLGQLLINEKKTTKQIDVSDLPSGSYIIEVQFDKSEIIRKPIVIR